MKRFEFKLQPLLRYRQYLEKLAQQDTAKAHLDVRECEELIAHLKKSHDIQAQEIETVVESGVSAREFRQHHLYLDAMETGIEEETKREAQLRAILRQKLDILKKKSVDKKAMELYRERLKTKYGQEFLKMEQKELDEISSLKTARTLSNETK